MDVNKMHRKKKVKWEPYKNAMSCFEQHFIKHQLYGHLPPISQTIQVRHLEHCCRNGDELKVLLWTLTHGHTNIDWPAKTYIDQLCANTRCSQEVLPGMMDDEIESENCAVSMILWWCFLSSAYSIGLNGFQSTHALEESASQYDWCYHLEVKCWPICNIVFNDGNKTRTDSKASVLFSNSSNIFYLQNI